MKKNFWGGKDRGRQWNGEGIKDSFFDVGSINFSTLCNFGARFSLQVLATLPWRTGFSCGLFTSIGAAAELRDMHRQPGTGDS